MKCQNYDIIILVAAAREPCWCKTCDRCRLKVRRADENDGFVHKFWDPFIRYLRRGEHRVKVIILYGDCSLEGLPLEKEDYLQYKNLPDKLGAGTIHKTCLAIKHVNANYEYKQIFRTCVSSFIVLEELLSRSASLGATNLYAGTAGKTMGPWHHGYASGEGIWLSADVADRIVREERLLTTELKKTTPDDVVIGVILRRTPHRELPSLVVDRHTLKADSQGMADVPQLVAEITDAGVHQVTLSDPDDRAVDLLLVEYLTEKFYPVELQHEDEYTSLYAATVSTRPAKARVGRQENRAEFTQNPQPAGNLNPKVAAVLRGCGGVIRGPKSGNPKR
jgi:hypothetical protein